LEFGTFLVFTLILAVELRPQNDFGTHRPTDGPQHDTVNTLVYV